MGIDGSCRAGSEPMHTRPLLSQDAQEQRQHAICTGRATWSETWPVIAPEGVGADGR